jgi:hypothetical protein
LHRLSSSFILGYHGCDRQVAEELLNGTPFASSENDWDWLGSGVYFWEANPLRGIEFAREWQRKGKIIDPYVIGAVVDLGFCLDLISSNGVAAVKSAYGDFLAYTEGAGVRVPKNRGGSDRLRRELDCAVINHLHKVRDATALTPFDSVRGVFVEGERIYSEAGFFQKTHIQICVRNVACIKGVFRVSDDQLRT